MRPAGRERRARAGFALPLAIFFLLAMSLVTALLLDRGVQELRAARGEAASARALAASEGGIARALSAEAGDALVAPAPGGERRFADATASETTSVVVQALGGGLVRIVSSARSHARGTRADRGTIAFAEVIVDSASGLPRLRRLPGVWTVPIP